MKRLDTGFLVQGAVIAAIYVALTVLFAPISFGPIQFRVSEALCVLPYFTLAAVPGVSAGCLLGNILGGAPLPDILFGSLATLLGALLSYRLRSVSRWLVCVPPILTNALIIPLVLRYAYGVPDMLPYLALTVGIGELLAVAGLGNLLLLALLPNRTQIFGKADASADRPRVFPR
ncbi:QueT transporter family protein [Oribacterium sp. oral taxon 102]|uniref:QueT transporter family protein n=1 Tax=Oribacterium sp. oral taxon 102 TaxID=671214 RepID=UPI0015BD0330|nr:QueT transporter family protein [Oribacterium sp. oral taxon 102]NWO21093.1 QueT transporter family protein [Oribacterium sp. oral taxon 102]